MYTRSWRVPCESVYFIVKHVHLHAPNFRDVRFVRFWRTACMVYGGNPTIPRRRKLHDQQDQKQGWSIVARLMHTPAHKVQPPADWGDVLPG
jgi:hypothetical protein